MERIALHGYVLSLNLLAKTCKKIRLLLVEHLKVSSSGAPYPPCFDLDHYGAAKQQTRGTCAGVTVQSFRFVTSPIRAKPFLAATWFRSSRSWEHPTSVQWLDPDPRAWMGRRRQTVRCFIQRFGPMGFHFDESSCDTSSSPPVNQADQYVRSCRGFA